MLAECDHETSSEYTNLNSHDYARVNGPPHSSTMSTAIRFCSSVSKPCGFTHKMAFEWRHRVLATVSGHRDRIVLRDTVWVDETYVNDTDLSKGYGQARKCGLPRQKQGICVAIDVHKNPVAVACGHGKPCSARVRKAMSGRIAPRSPLIHYPERAHNALVRDGGLESEAHRVDVNDPVCLERMMMVNDLCSRLKRYLGGTYRSLRRLTSIPLSKLREQQ